MSEILKGVICPSDIGLNENCNEYLDCFDCFRKSLEEHDAKVIADAIDECVSLPTENIFGIEYIRKSDVEQLKEQKNDD